MTPGARTGLGIITGAAIGATMIIGGPLGAIIGGAAGAWLARSTVKSPTTAHKQQQQQALQSTATPSQLRTIASKLDSVGLGDPLRARANLRDPSGSAPAPAVRRSALQSAASSKNAAQAQAAAAQFQNLGAQVTAEMLHDYARGLKALEQSRGTIVAETIVLAERRRT